MLKLIATKYVKISTGIDSNGVITLVNTTDTNETISSTITNTNGNISTDTVVASFTGLITIPTTGGTLNFSIPDTTNKMSGEYTGTLTFTITISPTLI